MLDASAFFLCFGLLPVVVLLLWCSFTAAVLPLLCCCLDYARCFLQHARALGPAVCPQICPSLCPSASTSASLACRHAGLGSSRRIVVAFPLFTPPLSHAWGCVTGHVTIAMFVKMTEFEYAKCTEYRAFLRFFFSFDIFYWGNMMLEEWQQTTQRDHSRLARGRAST